MTSEREMLIDQVLDQIKKDVDAGDFTAIHEMLIELPNKTLLAYLPEEMR